MIATVTLVFLTQSLFIFAGATDEIDVRAGGVNPFCGEMLEVIMEIVIVCVFFCITTTLMNRAGTFKKTVRKQELPRTSGTGHDRYSESFYNSALQKHADIGDLSGCATLCKEMRAHNIQPSEATFLILFDACINAEDFDRASSLLEDLCPTGIPFSSPRFLHRIKALVDVGCLDEVRNLLERITPMFGVCQETSVFQIMLKAYARLGDHRGWAHTFNLTIRSGVHLDALAIEIALASFPSEPAHGQDVLGVFESLIAHGLEPSQGFISAALRSLSKTRSWEGALSFLSKMQNQFGMRPEALHYENLAYACAKSGDVDSMDRIYNAMTESVGSTIADGVRRRCKIGGLTLQGSHLPWRASTTPTSPEASRRDLHLTAQHTDGQARSSSRLNQFIALNRLDARCARALRRVPSVQSDWVMDQDFIIQVDHVEHTASSRVLSTMDKLESKDNDFWERYPTNFDLAKRLSDFAFINKLDARCVKTLEKLSAESRQWVMDQEFAIQVDPSKGTASAKVIGQVLKLRSSS